MASGTVTLRAEQGIPFRLPLRWKDPDGELIDTSGYTAQMQIRKHRNSTEVLHELTDTEGITLGGDSYNLLLEIPQDVMETLPVGSAVYDLEVQPGTGARRRLLSGLFVVSGEVTR